MDAKELARSARVIAVVGASPDPARASYEVLEYLVERGYDVIPVRPDCESILGLPCVASLADIDRPIDLVDVFRKSEAAADVAREAAAVGAKGVWLQEGVRSEEAARIAKQADMGYAQDVCLKKVLQALAREEAAADAGGKD
jgi:uncharacterized protein